MKNKFRFALISILLISLGAGRLQAGDDGLAALGGFVAGVITGVIIEDSHDRDRVRVSVYGERGHRDDRYGHRDYRYGHKSSHGPAGHWETKRVRVWVPGRWERGVNRCGDRVSVWRPGHYEWHKERVWVSYGDRGRRDGYCG